MQKSSQIFILIVFSILIVLSLSSNVSAIIAADKVTASMTDIRVPPWENCCRTFGVNYSDVSILGQKCCLNSTNVNACNQCVQNTQMVADRYVAPRDTRNSGQTTIIVGLWIYAILLFGSFLTLVINKIVSIARGTGFLGKKLMITMWIIFSLCILILLTVIVLIILNMSPSY